MKYNYKIDYLTSDSGYEYLAEIVQLDSVDHFVCITPVFTRIKHSVEIINVCNKLITDIFYI